MLTKLQSAEETPLDFVLNIEEASWVGALLCVGGFAGNFIYAFILDRAGRKVAIYCLAIPHMCLWILCFFATSIEYLYIARICGGLTGGGVYVVLPIFIGEIADSAIRGRLTSMFSLTLNIGILCGFVISSSLPYHLIPCVVIALPLLYMLFAMYFPETPQQLLRFGRIHDAEKSLKFYRNYKGNATKEEEQIFKVLFAELCLAVSQQQNPTDGTDGSVSFRDFCNTRALKAFCTGLVIIIINIYSGSFALINYMSSIFLVVKADLHPDTNTMIIGIVQIIGTVTAMYLVDRFGRKILMIISTSGMGIGMAALGMYAFYAEETDTDLSAYSAWLPLLLVAFIIFLSNIGLNSVTFVILVEIMPIKIRAKAISLCLAAMSLCAFGLLKAFPVLMDLLGLSATLWFCATICAFGLFYLTIFLKETKGKCLDNVES